MREKRERKREREREGGRGRERGRGHSAPHFVSTKPHTQLPHQCGAVAVDWTGSGCNLTKTSTFHGGLYVCVCVCAEGAAAAEGGGHAPA